MLLYFYTHLNFDSIMIYIIHKISVSQILITRITLKIIYKIIDFNLFLKK